MEGVLSQPLLSLARPRVRVRPNHSPLHASSAHEGEPDTETPSSSTTLLSER